MKRTSWKWMLAAVLACSALGAITLRSARATSASGVTSTRLVGPVSFDQFDVRYLTPGWKAWAKTQGPSDVYVVDIKIAPGGDTGWHSHPGLVYATVKSGVVTEYKAADCSRIVHAEGTGWVESSGEVHIARNEASTDVELIVLFLVPRGAPTRIDEPNPGCL